MINDVLFKWSLVHKGDLRALFTAQTVVGVLNRSLRRVRRVSGKKGGDVTVEQQQDDQDFPDQ